MNTVQDATSNPFSFLNPTQGESTQPSPEQSLGQEDFFALMTAQMQNQDPTKPLDNQQFIAQLAQFSTLNSMQQMQQSFETLSGSLQSLQTFQAFNLVGRSLLVDGNKAYLAAEQPLQGSVNLETAFDDLIVRIYGDGGQEIRTLSLGSQMPGQVDFTWDGLSNQGAPMAPGAYQIAIEGQADGETRSLTPQVWGLVESISVSQGGQNVGLQVAGLGDYSISEIHEIR